MKLKILIKTPKGHAKKTEKRIKPFLIGLRKVKLKSFSNAEDNSIIWEIEGSVRDCMKISNNAGRFEFFVKSLLENKMLKKTIRSKLKPEEEKELKDMLLKNTEVEVIKESTAQVIIDDRTWWERLKDNYRRNL
jgi:hypothetical protein|tara:strand:+ start:457 stop:858 length:402 start_codon:yes stop_codon:yes gene_type:complete